MANQRCTLITFLGGHRGKFTVKGSVRSRWGGLLGPGLHEHYRFEAPAEFTAKAEAARYARTLRRYFQANHRLPNLCGEGWRIAS